MGTKVKATIMHFRDGKRIRPGAIFELKEGEKPSRGMEVVKDEPAPKTGKERNKANGPSTFSEIAQKDGAAQQPKGASDDLV